MQPIKLTLFGGKKQKANYQLTALGKIKAEEYRISGPKGEVMTALESAGPCSVNELATATELSNTKVKQVVESLSREGWIRKVSEE